MANNALRQPRKEVHKKPQETSHKAPDNADNVRDSLMEGLIVFNVEVMRDENAARVTMRKT
jgi:hypothetical protein